MRTSMGNKWLLCMAAMWVVASGSAPADAQESAPQSIALERFYSAPAGDRLFGVPSPYAAGHKVPHVSLYIDYGHDPLTLRNKETLEYAASVVSNQLFLRANGSFALWNRLLVNLDVPVALIQTGDEQPNKFNIQSPSGPDFGDVRLGLRFRILGEYDSRFQLGVNGYLWFPTGTGNYVTDGWFRGLPQVVVGGRVITQRLPPFVYSFAVGPEIRSAIRYFDKIPLGSTIAVAGGGGVLLGKDKQIQVGPEFSVITPLREVSAQNLNIELLLGGKYRFMTNWEAGLALGPGLSSGIGTPDMRVVASVAYTPPWSAKDTDGDGIYDRDDACVHVKGIRHKDPKKHGCPSDRDEDTIIDVLDACPDVKGVLHPDPRKHGCPPDADEDGILDPFDACVTVKGIPHKDPKKHGCPSDRDEDGIYDVVDACPDVKGVADKDPKKHGCPPDRDGDTIYDFEDACPDVPGIRTGEPKTNGCPPDSDGDGFVDLDDACPNAPGVANKDPKKHGCPREYKLVRMEKQQLVLLEEVHFASGKWDILKESYPLVEAIATVLKEWPDLTKIEIQGHTDTTWISIGNQKLSENRANAVMERLINVHGVARERLTAAGFSEYWPVAVDTTPQGKELNRRVTVLFRERKKADGTVETFDTLPKPGMPKAPAGWPEGGLKNPAKSGVGVRPKQPATPPAGPAKPPAGPAKPPAGPAKPPAGPAKPPAGPAKPPAGPAKPPAGPAKPPVKPPPPPPVKKAGTKK